MPSNRYCQLCQKVIDRLTFPTKWDVCFDCEVDYGIGQDDMRRKQRDWFKTARYTGNFPLSFNFVLNRVDRHVLCSYCGKPTFDKEITRDHVYPKSRGGLIKTPACLTCNQKKADMLPIEFGFWFAKMGYDMAVIPIGYDWDGDP